VYLQQQWLCKHTSLLCFYLFSKTVSLKIKELKFMESQTLKRALQHLWILQICARFFMCRDLWFLFHSCVCILSVHYYKEWRSRFWTFSFQIFEIYFYYYGVLWTWGFVMFHTQTTKVTGSNMQKVPATACLSSEVSEIT
jgi:hypothetical protein